MSARRSKPLPKIFAENMERALLSLGHSVRYFAGSAGVGFSTAQRLGKPADPHNSTLATVDAVATALRVPAWSLLVDDLRPTAQEDQVLVDICKGALDLDSASRRKVLEYIQDLSIAQMGRPGVAAPKE